MNLEATYIRQRVPVLIKFCRFTTKFILRPIGRRIASNPAEPLLCLAALFFFPMCVYGADYENYNLPAKSLQIPAAKKLSYSRDKRFILRGDQTSLKAPSVKASEYLFAKQAFLSEKRDQAIRLLRQELDSGYKHNRDNMLLRLGQLYTEKYMELSYLENQYYSNKLEEWQKKKDLAWQVHEVYNPPFACCFL